MRDLFPWIGRSDALSRGHSGKVASCYGGGCRPGCQFEFSGAFCIVVTLEGCESLGGSGGKHRIVGECSLDDDQLSTHFTHGWRATFERYFGRKA